ncbi:hypothetical protein PV08_10677 [Exophiala spinifera]|uniref:Uncharacterized protein n=1 Tax=Exophiala spinifera TaxID=91928 RepID=A0A0D1ZEG1_9EURO|nr:uncharacterized protein PV08_10677 [Exophiala spinifera]KIW11377.1 hypothetical protein PV08_10677 [Exophiala spinifera]
MCNLFLPLCPFVLHSIATGQGQRPANDGPDAKILFSYLSRNPYKNSSDPDQAQLKPLALKTAKLYKRTSWHTCPCFFQTVSVLHPLPGPSKPVFGFAYKYCARCSAAARVLRPMRLGGIGDRSYKGDQYFNRCIFAGVQCIFADSVSSPDVYSNLTRCPPSSQPPPSLHSHLHPVSPAQGNMSADDEGEEQRGQSRYSYYRHVDTGEDSDDAYEVDGSNRSTTTHRETSLRRHREWMETTPEPETSAQVSRRRTFQSGLDAYLTETYGPRGGKDTRKK